MWGRSTACYSQQPARRQAHIQLTVLLGEAELLRNVEPLTSSYVFLCGCQHRVLLSVHKLQPACVTPRVRVGSYATRSSSHLRTAFRTAFRALRSAQRRSPHCPQRAMASRQPATARELACRRTCAVGWRACERRTRGAGLARALPAAGVRRGREGHRAGAAGCGPGAPRREPNKAVPAR